MRWGPSKDSYLYSHIENGIDVMESERVHRAVNVGGQPYEQVTIFLLDRLDPVPQPIEE